MSFGGRGEFDGFIAGPFRRPRVEGVFSGEDMRAWDTVWGDGSAERDFIHARDVARGMMLVVAKGVTEPVNLGSGRSTTIREVVEIAAASAPRRPEIRWDTSKPAGDRKRIMDVSRAQAHGFAPEIGIEEGIRSTFAWYLEHRHHADRRYNAFSEAALAPAPRLPA